MKQCLSAPTFSDSKRQSQTCDCSAAHRSRVSNCQRPRQTPRGLCSRMWPSQVQNLDFMRLLFFNLGSSQESDSIQIQMTPIDQTDPLERRVCEQTGSFLDFEPTTTKAMVLLMHTRTQPKTKMDPVPINRLRVTRTKLERFTGS